MTKNKKVSKVKSTKIVAKKGTKSVSKAPVKTVAKKPVAKPVNKSVQKNSKPLVKNTKTAAKQPVKKAAPATAKKAVAVKPAPKQAIVAKQQNVKQPAPVAKGAAPIVVKLPNNQNKNAVTTATVTMASPKTTIIQKTATQAAAPSAPRPAYRPIQVINKPLTPVQPQRAMAMVQPVSEKVEFKKGDYVVYPAHGVGQIEGVESQQIAGMEIKLYAIVFEKDRMRLKVPVFKAHASGLRRLSTGSRMQDALKTLQGRAQVRRAMWSRRAQEYETKINSGDPVAIAEVLRDLKRNTEEIEQSYSERQIYQSALERLAREVAALDKITEIEAAERLETLLRGSRRKAAAPAAEEVKADKKAA